MCMGRSMGVSPRWRQIQMGGFSPYTDSAQFNLYSVFFTSSASVKVAKPWQTEVVNINANSTKWLTQSPVWHHLMNLPGLAAGPVRTIRSHTASEPGASTIALRKGSVIAFGEASGASEIVVFRGSIWLTETPGTADYVLEEGDEYRITRQFPVVVQALADSVIMVG